MLRQCLESDIASARNKIFKHKGHKGHEGNLFGLWPFPSFEYFVSFVVKKKNQ